MDDISIAIITSYKLSERYNACKNTWAKDFDNVFFFGGDVYDPNIIRLEGLGEDYNSYFPKQQNGLKYMFEKNPNMQWYSVIGCDHIYFKNRLMEKLNQFDSNEDYIIGELHDHVTTVPRKINVDGIEITLISGGGGLFISNSLMKKMYDKIDEFNQYWHDINYVTYKCSGYPHGDVALCLMAKKYFNVDTTHLQGLHSQHPNFYPYKDIINPLTFHYIKGSEMNTIYETYK